MHCRPVKKHLVAVAVVAGVTGLLSGLCAPAMAADGYGYGPGYGAPAAAYPTSAPYPSYFSPAYGSPAGALAAAYPTSATYPSYPGPAYGSPAKRSW